MKQANTIVERGEEKGPTLALQEPVCASLRPGQEEPQHHIHPHSQVPRGGCGDGSGCGGDGGGGGGGGDAGAGVLQCAVKGFSSKKFTHFD